MSLGFGRKYVLCLQWSHLREDYLPILAFHQTGNLFDQNHIAFLLISALAFSTSILLDLIHWNKLAYTESIESRKSAFVKSSMKYEFNSCPLQ